MSDGNRRSYILKQTCRPQLQVCLSMKDVKKLDKTRNFCYSKNTNKINVHNRKNQNIPSGYLPAQSQQWKL